MSKAPSINTPTITIIFVLIGLFNLDNYYQRYGIEIYNYVDVQEILLSFTNMLPAAILLTLFYVLTFGWELSRVKQVDQNIYIKHHDEVEYIRYQKAVRRSIIVGSFVVVICCILFILYYYVGPSVRDSAHNNSMGFDLLSLVPISIICLTVVVSSKNEQQAISRIFLSFTVMVALLLGYLYLRNNLSYIYTVNGYPKYNVTISFKDNRTLVADNDSLLYIGAVKSYIFLRNRTDSTSLIIPTSEVREITISEARNGL